MIFILQVLLNNNNNENSTYIELFSTVTVCFLLLTFTFPIKATLSNTEV